MQASNETPAYFGVRSSVLSKRWLERPVDASRALAIAQRLKTGEIVGRLVAARGVELDRAESYLNPSLKNDLPDPSIVLDMDRAAARLAAAVQAGEGIAVFGDYDVDGATSSALLTRFLRAVGREPVVYIPDRLSEGYGPNVAAMTKLAREGAKVIVTVDCGTQAQAALEAARQAGADVIVCDHHLPGEALPPAFAIANPNRHDDTSGLGALAAVGVAFLLCVATNRALRTAGWFATRDEPDLRKWLSLVALGTVADVVPLTGLNRLFVLKGLEAARSGQHVRGVTALTEVAGVKGDIEPYHLGFVLGPRVNAGGRVGRCDLGTRLLASDDPAETAALARELDDLNQQRRALEHAALDEAIAIVESDPALRAECTLVVAREGWHPGVIGIVAGRLKDRYGRPAIAIAINDGIGKGSGRSVNGADLGTAIVAAREAGILLNGGGHKMAAGLTIDPARVADLASFLALRLAEDCARSDEGTLTVDGAVSPSGATADWCALIAKCGPYGAGNAEPLFVLPSVRVAFASIVGEQHVRCVLMGADGGRVAAIAFRALQSPLGTALLGAKGQAMHVACSLKADEWQGEMRVQATIKDLALAL